MADHTREFMRGKQKYSITVTGKGIVQVTGGNHSMQMDAHAVPSFIKNGKLKEITK